MQVNTRYGYIYKTTNLVNGKLYVGKHKGKFSDKYLGSGNIVLNAIKKYGPDNFSVKQLISAQSNEELNSLEKRLIDLHRKVFGWERLYNIADGGQGNSGKPSSETLLRISRALKGHPCWNGMKGKKHPPEVIKKMSASQKSLHREGAHGMLGKHHSDEAKLRISIALTGKNRPWLRKPRTDTTKANISASTLARNYSNTGCS